jgi:hypothetical protein
LFAFQSSCKGVCIKKDFSFKKNRLTGQFYIDFDVLPAFWFPQVLTVAAQDELIQD